jgi:RimJ/RimL family protein N-acetyltransferase
MSDPGAQQWLGWAEADLVTVPPGPVTLPLRQRSGIVRPEVDRLCFAAVDRETTGMVAAITIYRAGDGRLEVGGSVAAQHRGRGFGTETLKAVCELAHHHFGIAVLRAGCETTNVASIGWLRSVGFAQIAGPPTHRLPNGREIPALWWQHSSPRARRRCPWIAPNPLTADGLS